MNIPFQRDKKKKERKKWTGDKVHCNRGETNVKEMTQKRSQTQRKFEKVHNEGVT
jgi:hypothetical protein